MLFCDKDHSICTCVYINFHPSSTNTVIVYCPRNLVTVVTRGRSLCIVLNVVLNAVIVPRRPSCSQIYFLAAPRCPSISQKREIKGEHVPFRCKEIRKECDYPPLFVSGNFVHWPFTLQTSERKKKKIVSNKSIEIYKIVLEKQEYIHKNLLDINSSNLSYKIY